MVLLQRAILHKGLTAIGGIALSASTDELQLYIALLDLCSAKAGEDRELRTLSESLCHRLSEVYTPPYGDDVDILGGAIEEEVTHVAPNHVGLYSEAVSSLTNKMKEGGIYLVVDQIFVWHNKGRADGHYRPASTSRTLTSWGDIPGIREA